MSLKKQILLMMGVISFGLILFLSLVPANILTHSFNRMEVQDLADDMSQVREAVWSEQDFLLVKGMDWSAWDDTYRYVVDHNFAYKKSNLNAASLANLKINYFAILDTKLKPRDLFEIDIANAKFLPISKSFKDFIQSKNSFFMRQAPGSSRTGLIQIPEGTVLVASMPIITSEQEGPVRGTLVFGRRIDGPVVARMQKLTHRKIRVEAISEEYGRQILAKFPKLLGEESFASENVGDNESHAHTVLKDIDGRPTTLVSISRTRPIHHEGKQTIFFVIVSVLLAALAFCVGSVLFFQRRVLTRLYSLGKTVRRVGAEGDLSIRCTDSSKDELGELAHSMNDMFDLLEQSQTEIKSASSQLQIANSQLIERVAEAQRLNRKLEATQQQLLQSQKLESIGRLAGGVAHDFNNLLGAILGNIELVEPYVSSDEKVRRYVAVIHQSAQRASELTRQLLGFARRTKGEKTEIDLNATIEETVKLLARSIPKNILLRMELAKPLKKIEGDSTQIFQVLMNLAINARDAMPKGGTLLFQTENVTVDETILRSMPSLTTGPYIRLRVSDTGTGIPKDIQSKIFDPFFSTKETGKGTGLGLSMVYGILKEHQGAIGLYSEPNVGTVFSLYFPARAETNVELLSHGESKAILPSKPLTGSHILVVDDEEMLLETAKDVLEFAGAQVTMAKNGVDAINKFKKAPTAFQAILSDIMMPEMNGVELAKEILKLDPKIPILLSSGYNENREVDELRKNPLVGFLQKPYRADELIQKLFQALKPSAGSTKNSKSA